MRIESFLAEQKQLKNDYVCARYMLWTFFSLCHISFILLVMIGGFWWWFCLFLHPVVQIQWTCCKYHCVGTLLERYIHPRGISLYGRIRWWSIILLWADWVVVLLWNIKK